MKCFKMFFKQHLAYKIALYTQHNLFQNLHVPLILCDGGINPFLFQLSKDNPMRSDYARKYEELVNEMAIDVRQEKNMASQAVLPVSAPLKETLPLNRLSDRPFYFYVFLVLFCIRHCYSFSNASQSKVRDTVPSFLSEIRTPFIIFAVFIVIFSAVTFPKKRETKFCFCSVERNPAPKCGQGRAHAQIKGFSAGTKP